MPIKTDASNEHHTMYNFYINRVEQLEFIKKVTESGHLRAQSAALRALMHLYVTDPEVTKKANAIIDKFIVYKKDGNISKK